MQSLAREKEVTVLLVTHDNRILDIADRIVHLEDGRLSSFTDAVAFCIRNASAAFMPSTLSNTPSSRSNRERIGSFEDLRDDKGDQD